MVSFKGLTSTLSENLETPLNSVVRPIATKKNGSNQRQIMMGNEFRLHTALQLAGCSEEAYLVPQSEPQYVARIESSVNTRGGLEVTYTCSEYLQREYAGVLAIHVDSATIKNTWANYFFRNDAYVTVHHQGRWAQSVTIYNSREPQWAQELFLYTSKKEWTNETITVKLWERNTLLQDTLLGQTSLTLTPDLLNSQPIHRKLQLFKHNKDTHSELKVDIKYLPFSAVDGLLKAADNARVKLRMKKDGPEELLLDQYAPNRGLLDNIHKQPKVGTQEVGGVMKDVGLGDAGKNTRWQDLAVRVGAQKKDFYKPLCYLDQTATDTQVLIYENVHRKEVVLAFRGTQFTHTADRWTDYKVWKLPFVTLCGKKLGHVHMGFRRGFMSVREHVVRMVESIIADRAGWRVLCTGHSLGGALATLMAAELGHQPFISRVSMYNYGSPRVGNQKFLNSLYECVDEVWRVRNFLDVVSTIPLPLPICGVYAHVQPALLLGLPAYKDSKSCPRDMQKPENGYAVEWDLDGSILGRALGDLFHMVPDIIKEARVLRWRRWMFPSVSQHMLGAYHSHMSQLVQRALDCKVSCGEESSQVEVVLRRTTEDKVTTIVPDDSPLSARIPSAPTPILA